MRGNKIEYKSACLSLDNLYGKGQTTFKGISYIMDITLTSRAANLKWGGGMNIWTIHGK